MDDILKELGWGDGFRVPVANDENRALELEIQKKEKQKKNLKFTSDSLAERLTAMKKHYENVQHQLAQNQNLIFAQNNQKIAEEHLVKLARVEVVSLSDTIKKLKKEEKDIQDRLKGVQGDIDRAHQHVEKLNETLKWDKGALLAWDEEVTRGDEDTQMLEKFIKKDETKFKELELKRQYLGVDVENKKNRLLSLKNDIAALEKSLDKTAQMFRQQHVDRRTLVHQWEGSVRILRERDDDINRIMEEIGNLKSLAKDRLKDLEEQKTFYENEVKNNQELERDIEIINKHNEETKEKVKMLEKFLAEEEDNLQSLKTHLGKTASLLQKEIMANKNCGKEIIKAKEHLEEINGKKEKVKEEYENLKRKAYSASERLGQLEKMLEEEEKNLEKNVTELKKLNDLMFQIMQQAKELRDGELNQTSSIQHIQACMGSAKKDIAKAKIELKKQKEALYNIDFAYMEKDIYFNKLLKTSKDENSEKDEKRLEELEETQRKLTATNNLLTKEVNRLEDYMRRVTQDLQSDAREENYLKNKRQEDTMIFEGGQKQLKHLQIQNQNRQVEENVLKLRVRQAENMIDKVGGKVFCLEKQRLELEEAMKEREIEIKTFRDVLNVRRKVLTEQTSNMNGRISLAKVKVENLKGKYQVEILKLGKDEYGEPLSVTHLKIKAAQEKFELQELGDKLDSQIKKTEKEIEAMENTLKVVNATNKAFKNNLQNIPLNSPEILEKERLEKNQAQVLSEYRKKKAFLDSLQVITLNLEEEYQQKLKMEEAIINSWKEKDQLAAETDRELREQEEKLERAGKQLKKLIKEIRGTKALKFQTMEEKDIELRELMDQNEYGLQQLAELVAKTYDTAPVVMRYLSEKGLSLPIVRSPAVSLKCPSTASLPSARSSASSRSSKSTDSTSSTASRSSSCVFSPSVVTLDSSRLCESSESVERRPCGASRRKSQSDVKKKGSK